MSYIFAGVALILISNAAALSLAMTIRIADYQDIARVCALLNETAAECSSGAMNAGWTMLAGALITGAIAWLTSRCHGSTRSLPEGEGWASRLFLLGTVALICVHVVVLWHHGPAPSRLEVIERTASLISAENIVWPLLLQLAGVQRTMRSRLLYLAPAIYLAGISSFRGILFAVVFFGILVPLADRFMSESRRRVPRNRVITNASVLGCCCAALLYLVYMQTVARSAMQSDDARYGHSLEQRIASPLFQAHLAERLSSFMELPDMGREVERKLRLTDLPNLNEFLYRRIYGEESFGETTSLFYGEAVSNSRSHPLVWTVLAPLMLMWCWILLCRCGFDVGILFGVAIWRGSLGGLSTVLPALTLQVIAFIAISLLQRGRIHRVSVMRLGQ